MKKRPEEKQYRDAAQKILSTSPSELALQELSLEQNGDTMIKLSNLTPHPDNPRKITDAQMDKLKESIRRDPEYMQPRPLVVNQDNIILAGNQRWKALQALGYDEIPEDWVRFVDWDEEKSRRFVIMDNHQSGEWDEEILLARWMDVDLEGLGVPFDVEVETENEGLTDEDDVPDEPAEPVSKTGDIWLLGEHRVMCGDSTSKADVERLMGGVQADLCFTSPPYAQQRDYNNKIEDWDLLMQGVFGNLPMSEKGQVLVNLGLIHRDGEWIPYWEKWIEWMREQGWRRFGWYVWDQGPGMPGDWAGRMAPSHEFVFHFNIKTLKPFKARLSKHAGERHGGKGQRNAAGVVTQRHAGTAPVQSHSIFDSVFRVNRQGASYSAGGHPAPFPVGLPELIIQSWPGAIYDPFLGSGTTIIAAEKTNRICYGMEISPAYVDVIITRWQNFTGKDATRESDGVKWSEASYA